MTVPAAGNGPDDHTLMMREIGRRARSAARQLAQCAGADKNRALIAAAAALQDCRPAILAANQRDLAAAEALLGAAQLDRLTLTAERIAAMAGGLVEIAALKDPIGEELARWQRPNGLDIARIRVPIGVIGIIYESRPNVTADAGGLCLKSGNAAILRGGSESFHSSVAIMDCLQQGLAVAGLPPDCLQLVPTIDRAAVGAMLRLAEFIDVIVPRGGRSLIERVSAESRIPLFQHLEGVNHIYVDAAADLAMARDVLLNAKLRRPAVCGATETLLVDRAVAASHLGPLIGALLQAGCEVRGDAAAEACDPRVRPASPEDWSTEYLDRIISVRLVDGLEDAMAHIDRYGSHHTDAIITNDPVRAEAFLAGVDSAILMVNASTQFADGGEFGMGAEIGISTGKLHARGPVGVEQLTSFKYLVRGNGQVRP
jgi:glutamate-5-semialdehyde dehydrogenase